MERPPRNPGFWAGSREKGHQQPLLGEFGRAWRRETWESARTARPARRPPLPASPGACARPLSCPPHEAPLFYFLPSSFPLLLFSRCLVLNTNHLFFFLKYFKIFLHL